jgi:hypothetical protein
VELLFSAGGTFVFSQWNFYFILVELLFSAGGTFISSWWNCCFVQKTPTDHLQEILQTKALFRSIHT